MTRYQKINLIEQKFKDPKYQPFKTDLVNIYYVNNVTATPDDILKRKLTRAVDNSHVIYWKNHYDNIKDFGKEYPDLVSIFFPGKHGLDNLTETEQKIMQAFLEEELQVYSKYVKVDPTNGLIFYTSVKYNYRGNEWLKKEDLLVLKNKLENYRKKFPELHKCQERLSFYENLFKNNNLYLGFLDYLKNNMDCDFRSSCNIYRSYNKNLELDNKILEIEFNNIFKNNFILISQSLSLSEADFEILSSIDHTSGLLLVIYFASHSTITFTENFSNIREKFIIIKNKITTPRPLKKIERLKIVSDNSPKNKEQEVTEFMTLRKTLRIEAFALDPKENLLLNDFFEKIEHLTSKKLALVLEKKILTNKIRNEIFTLIKSLLKEAIIIEKINPFKSFNDIIKFLKDLLEQYEKIFKDLIKFSLEKILKHVIIDNLIYDFITWKNEFQTNIHLDKINVFKEQKLNKIENKFFISHFNNIIQRDPLKINLISLMFDNKNKTDFYHLTEKELSCYLELIDNKLSSKNSKDTISKIMLDPTKGLISLCFYCCSIEKTKENKFKEVEQFLLEIYMSLNKLEKANCSGFLNEIQNNKAEIFKMMLEPHMPYKFHNFPPMPLILDNFTPRNNEIFEHDISSFNLSFAQKFKDDEVMFFLFPKLKVIQRLLTTLDKTLDKTLDLTLYLLPKSQRLKTLENKALTDLCICKPEWSSKGRFVLNENPNLSWERHLELLEDYQAVFFKQNEKPEYCSPDTLKSSPKKKPHLFDNLIALLFMDNSVYSIIKLSYDKKKLLLKFLFEVLISEKILEDIAFKLFCDNSCGMNILRFYIFNKRYNEHLTPVEKEELLNTIIQFQKENKMTVFLKNKNVNPSLTAKKSVDNLPLLDLSFNLNFLQKETIKDFVLYVAYHKEFLENPENNLKIKELNLISLMYPERSNVQQLTEKERSSLHLFIRNRLPFYMVDDDNYYYYMINQGDPTHGLFFWSFFFCNNRGDEWMSFSDYEHLKDALAVFLDQKLSLITFEKAFQARNLMMTKRKKSNSIINFKLFLDSKVNYQYDEKTLRYSNLLQVFFKMSEQDKKNFLFDFQKSHSFLSDVQTIASFFFKILDLFHLDLSGGFLFTEYFLNSMQVTPLERKLLETFSIYLDKYNKRTSPKCNLKDNTEQII